ncbi:hypothetical protein GGS23DRAFT_559128 [Durotheca rogersii]|uniref:uncharacterized protein n=1 Tax=Durotheca rogersii TaxID=419775 RepID=UPI00221F6E12|nr:uncharacterized protein GGS23DRAFT_559128 [Durotheca rogersii]KAI5865405.1 hypothetical protein GGS23DRAFT_559128 [Durotheca rogersii]
MCSLLFLCFAPAHLTALAERYGHCRQIQATEHGPPSSVIIGRFPVPWPTLTTPDDLVVGCREESTRTRPAKRRRRRSFLAFPSSPALPLL